MRDPVIDVAVLGAGILGLAAARRLLADRPDLRVSVFDKEPRVAAHQSSHNSGVLHAGVYYPPGSAKARLCTAGKRELEAYCDERGIPYEHNGKVIVALDESELSGLARLTERARANGVPGVREIGRDELTELEPHVAGIRALHSPTTGVVDFAAVAEALARDVEAAGGAVHLGRGVVDLAEHDRHVLVRTVRGDVPARVVLSCAGLQSDRVAGWTGDAGDVRIVPFRGSWLRLRPHAADLVRGNVYPVPDPGLPFLGVHATRRLDGEVWIGPNAVLAPAREGYDRGQADLRDLAEVAGFPGFWRLAARNVTTGARELWQDRVTRAYVREVRRYLPEVTPADVEPGPSGIRAQAVRTDGAMVDDFSIGGSRRLVHVRNAPSPAATASLAIARVLAGEVVTRLE